MLNPIAMAIVVRTFPGPKERAQALGVWGAVFGVSMAAGPVLGGLLVDAIGWRSIFWVNVPVGAVALALTARFIPESRAERPRRFDLVAQALLVVGLFSLTSAVIDGRRVGWASWTIAAGFGVALASLVAFIAWESRRAEPLLDLRLFRSLSFASATALAVLSFAAFSGFLFLNALYLQEARGLQASSAGLVTLPIALALIVCSPLSGRLVGAGHARLAIVLAGAAITTGALLLTAPGERHSSARARRRVRRLRRGARPHRSTRQHHGRRGHASNRRPRWPRPSRRRAVRWARRSASPSLDPLAGSGVEFAPRAHLAEATHPVFWLIAVCGVVIVALGVLSTGARARASADRVAVLLREPDVGPTSLPAAVGQGDAGRGARQARPEAHQLRREAR